MNIRSIPLLMRYPFHSIYFIYLHSQIFFMRRHLLFFLLSLVSISPVLAQPGSGDEILSKYDPQALFSPLFYPTGGTVYRAPTGEPGSQYWQNKADYQISAELNDVTHEIKGSVTITYRNNSPYSLPYIWLQRAHTRKLNP